MPSRCWRGSSCAASMSARAGPTSRPISSRACTSTSCPSSTCTISMRLARAGEQSAVTEMLASLEDRAEHAKPFEREAWADCAVPAAHGLAAYAKGDACRGRTPARPGDAASAADRRQHRPARAVRRHPSRRADQVGLERRRARRSCRPTSASGRPCPGPSARSADLYRKLGRTEQALAAEYQAEQLARQYAQDGKRGRPT